MSIVPFAKWEPVPSHSGPMAGHQGLVLHVQVGNGDCYGEFDVPANQASSTWWVSKTGQLVQYVDSDVTAWTEAQGNPYWDSVETEGLVSEPLTDAQILTLARLYVWGHQKYGWPLVMTDDVNAAGFIWHGAGGAAWGGHTGCPGDLRKPQRAAVLFIAGLVLNPAPGQPPAPAPPKETSMIAQHPTAGYAVLRPDGAVDCYDGAPSFGSMFGRPMNAPLVGIAYTATGKGYWLLGADGGIFCFGDAVGHGPALHYLPTWGIGVNTNIPLIGLARRADGGYDLVADNPAAPAVQLYSIPTDNSLAK